MSSSSRSNLNELLLVQKECKGYNNKIYLITNHIKNL